MLESRWFRRAGPGIVALGAVALVASTTLGAGDRPWEPPPCPDSTASATARHGTVGAWFRVDPWVVDGERRGQHLALGTADGAPARIVELDAESFAAGPLGDRVLVGTDDGTASRLSIIDLRVGCSRPLAASADVIRRATLSPDGTTAFEFRVDRVTRADLGVWRRELRAPEPATRVLAPIAADARFGRTWSTEFAWSLDGSRLAVQSCGEVACRTRVLDPAVARVQTIAEPDLGLLAGLTRDRAVLHAACRGLPCPLYSVAIADGGRTILDPAAGRAALAVDPDGRPRAVHEVGGAGPDLRSVWLDGTGELLLRADPSGARLVPGASGSQSGVEVGPEWLALAGADALGAGAPQPPRLRHPIDEPAVTLEEALR
ncbi:MAG TPA: hypothetical protein VIH00_10920 [Candidatus Limnocylindrales bacterium]